MSEYVPTAEQVNAFKAAWHDADDDGQAGKRVEIALAKVLGPALAVARREGLADGWDACAANVHHAGLVNVWEYDQVKNDNPYRKEAGQ